MAKQITVRGDCRLCKKEMNVKKLYKFTWRYNDKERTYRNSKIKMIHTGAAYLCKKCLQYVEKTL